jgi:ligand-binding sensor domain-containing protein
MCGWRWTNFSTSLGHPLPNSSITAIAVDARHRVWFGSNCCYDNPNTAAAGLTVLDGTTWITYTAANSGLTYNRIRSLEVDKQDRIWIGQTDSIAIPTRAVPDTVDQGAGPTSLPAKGLVKPCSVKSGGASLGHTQIDSYSVEKVR